MAKLPSFKRLFKSDYPTDQQNLVETLSSSLNIGIESLYEALNKKLTFKDNFLGSTKEVLLEVGISGEPKITTGFSLDGLTTPIEGLMVVRAENLTNSSVYPTSGVFVSYTQSGGSIIINHVTGLQANNKYKLKVIALG